MDGLRWMDGLCWYVVEAEQGRDFSACLILAQTMPDVWRPLDPARSTIRSKMDNKAGALASNSTRVTRKEPRFGRYFFVKCQMNPAVESAILDLTDKQRNPLVHSILRSKRGDAPSPIPDEQILFWRKNKPVKSPQVAKIKRGAVVEVTDGPFKGHLGGVSAIDECGIVKVDINIFGRLTPIIFEVGHVALRELGQRPPKQAA